MGLGGGDILKKKYFSFSYMYNTKSDHFSIKIKQDMYGNMKSNANHEKETKSELVYEDGSICLTLVFIKFLGSDTL